jgi:hypothetical protein
MLISPRKKAGRKRLGHHRRNAQVAHGTHGRIVRMAIAKVAPAHQQVAALHTGGKVRVAVGHGQGGELFDIGDLDVAHPDDEVDVVVGLVKDPGHTPAKIGQGHGCCA